MPETLHGLVELAAERFPERPAVISPDGALSYRELWDLSARWAGALAAAGVVPGDRVGLYQPKSTTGVAQIIGILRAGAAYVPVDPNSPPDRAFYVFDHAEVSAVLAADRPRTLLLERASELGRPAPAPPDPEIVAGSGLSAPRLDVAATQLAYVLYTSGSTGQPKGVAITHGQSLAFVLAATPIFEIAETDILASHAPFNFDLSIIDLFCAFSSGAAVSLIPEKWLSFPAKLAAWIEESGITVWNSVPSALIQLTTRGALDKRKLEELRLIMFAGEPYPTKQLRKLVAAFPRARIMNVYGQTEANSSTFYDLRTLPEDDAAVLPIGRTFPGYQVLVLGDDGQPVSTPNVEGELYVVGGAVASGYFKDPERTKNAFVPHPIEPSSGELVYRTGDRVAFDDNGDLVFRGRQDAAVKVRGFRVELSELESQSAALAGVDEAAAVAVPHEAEGHRLHLFIASAQAPETLTPLIEKHLAEKLPPYMRPASIRVQAGALPKTGTGKTDRQVLAKRITSEG